MFKIKFSGILGEQVFCTNTTADKKEAKELFYATMLTTDKILSIEKTQESLHPFIGNLPKRYWGNHTYYIVTE